MKLISYRFTHICTLLFLIREFARKTYWVEWRKRRHFIDDSSERFWLVIAFISSTESRVIVIMRSAVETSLSLAQCQPADAGLNLAADDRRAERFNHAGVIVLNIENIHLQYFVLWKLHSKSTWSKKFKAPSLWMAMTPLITRLN